MEIVHDSLPFFTILPPTMHNITMKRERHVRHQNGPRPVAMSAERCGLLTTLGKLSTVVAVRLQPPSGPPVRDTCFLAGSGVPVTANVPP